MKRKPVIRKHPDGGGCWTCHYRDEWPRLWAITPDSAYRSWEEAQKRRAEHAADLVFKIKPGQAEYIV